MLLDAMEASSGNAGASSSDAKRQFPDDDVDGNYGHKRLCLEPQVEPGNDNGLNAPGSTASSWAFQDGGFASNGYLEYGPQHSALPVDARAFSQVPDLLDSGSSSSWTLPEISDYLSDQPPQDNLDNYSWQEWPDTLNSTTVDPFGSLIDYGGEVPVTSNGSTLQNSESGYVPESSPMTTLEDVSVMAGVKLSTNEESQTLESGSQGGVVEVPVPPELDVGSAPDTTLDLGKL